MTAYSERIQAALEVSAQAHAAQVRKGSEIPYITHPFHGALILTRYGYGEDVIVAALLHDVVEDAHIPLSDLEKQFGPSVAVLVSALTETKRDEAEQEIPWETRRAEHLVRLREASPEAAAIKAADMLHNARTTAHEITLHGNTVWSRFKRGPLQILENYLQTLEIVQAKLGDHPLAADLEQAIQALAIYTQP